MKFKLVNKNRILDFSVFLVSLFSSIYATKINGITCIIVKQKFVLLLLMSELNLNVW